MVFLAGHLELTADSRLCAPGYNERITGSGGCPTGSVGDGSSMRVSTRPATVRSPFGPQRKREADVTASFVTDFSV